MGKSADVVKKTLDAFLAGNIDGVSTMLDESYLMHVPGTNQLSGEYKGKQEFVQGFIGKIMELTGNQFKLEPHAVCDDGGEHATGIYRISATRNGKTFEYQHVNVYHVANGKIAEAWQFPGDFEAWNKFWS